MMKKKKKDSKGKLFSVYLRKTKRSNMKKSILLLSLFLLAFISCGKHPTAQDNEAEDSLSLLVMQIKKCSRLYTAEYKVRKIITHQDQLQLTGTLLSKSFDLPVPVAGTRQVAIPIEATLKAYVDFSDFSEKNIRKKGNQLEIILPDPKIELTSTRIDYQGIRSNIPLLRGRFRDEELENYERQGRKAILDDVPRMGMIETARRSAAEILIPIAKAMGYPQNHITITLRKDFRTGDLQKLLDATKTETEHERE